MNLPSDSNGESDLSFWFYKEISCSLSLSFSFNDVFLLFSVFLVVFLSVGGDCLSLFCSLLLGLISSILQLLQDFGVSGLLLLHVLRDNSKEVCSMSKIYTLAFLLLNI